METESNIMFTIVPIFIMLVVVIIVGIILFRVFSSIKQRSYNNKQPVLTVFSKIVSKRSKVSTSSGNNQDNHIHYSTHTTYFATFEVESGDRIEFSIQDREFGLLAEGDQGKLSFQGTRYLSFSRVTA
jgi:NADH:ubiquinone oxidoreductase subunit 3 (subunit A)